MRKSGGTGIRDKRFGSIAFGEVLGRLYCV
jgi:hypothetical protein